MANMLQCGRNEIARPKLVRGQMFEHLSLESGEGTKTRRCRSGTCCSHLCCEVQPRRPGLAERRGCGSLKTRQRLDRVEVAQWRDQRRSQCEIQCIVINRLKEATG